ncbi:MAG: hypothetical protein OXH38_11815 [Chloroflexi bacterium]|nr:hypothetical protein [Chloroflexota bacterium]
MSIDLIGRLRSAYLDAQGNRGPVAAAEDVSVGLSNPPSAGDNVREWLRRLSTSVGGSVPGGAASRWETEALRRVVRDLVAIGARSAPNRNVSTSTAAICVTQPGSSVQVGQPWAATQEPPQASWPAQVGILARLATGQDREDWALRLVAADDEAWIRGGAWSPFTVPSPEAGFTYWRVLDEVDIRSITSIETWSGSGGTMYHGSLAPGSVGQTELEAALLRQLRDVEQRVHPILQVARTWTDVSSGAGWSAPTGLLGDIAAIAALAFGNAQVGGDVSDFVYVRIPVGSTQSNWRFRFLVHGGAQDGETHNRVLGTWASEFVGSDDTWSYFRIGFYEGASFTNGLLQSAEGVFVWGGGLAPGIVTLESLASEVRARLGGDNGGGPPVGGWTASDLADAVLERLLPTRRPAEAGQILVVGSTGAWAPTVAEWSLGQLADAVLARMAPDFTGKPERLLRVNVPADAIELYDDPTPGLGQEIETLVQRATDLGHEIDRLEALIEPTVAFKVALASGTALTILTDSWTRYSPTSDGFGAVQVNEGGWRVVGYGPSAPMDGLYHLHLELVGTMPAGTRESLSIRFGIRRDGALIPLPEIGGGYVRNIAADTDRQFARHQEIYRLRRDDQIYWEVRAATVFVFTIGAGSAFEVFRIGSAVAPEPGSVVHQGWLPRATAAAASVELDDSDVTHGLVEGVWTFRNIPDSGEYIGWWAVPAAQDQPSSFKIGPFEVLDAVQAGVARTIGATNYTIYLFEDDAYCDATWNGQTITIEV